MGTTFAPPYACLAIGFLEETLLYPQILSNFDPILSKYVIDYFYRYMDDGFVPWPSDADINIFKDLLNNLDSKLKFTLEPPKKYTTIGGKEQQKLNFLDITVILHETGKIKTDIYYKETNSHDYLSYHSHHPEHIKKNIPYNLAKRIIIFCSDGNTEKSRLQELEKWLLQCDYPPNIIKKAFHNAKLQGPAPQRKACDTLPLITTFASNYDCSQISKKSTPY